MSENQVVLSEQSPTIPGLLPGPAPQLPVLGRQAPLMATEGTRMSLEEEGRLQSSGVLLGGQIEIQAYGLTEDALALFLAVAGAMPEGLARSRIPRRLAARLTEHLLVLEIQELVQWLRDARGRQTHLVLTWRGQDTFDAARPQPRHSTASRRRAALARTVEVGRKAR